MYYAIHHRLIYWVHLCSTHCTSLPRVRITRQSSASLFPAPGLCRVPILPWSVQQAVCSQLSCTLRCFSQSRCILSLNHKRSTTLIKSKIVGKSRSSRKGGTPAGGHGTRKAPGSTGSHTGSQTEVLLAPFYRMEIQLGQLRFPFATFTSLQPSCFVNEAETERWSRLTQIRFNFREISMDMQQDVLLVATPGPLQTPAVPSSNRYRSCQPRGAHSLCGYKWQKEERIRQKCKCLLSALVQFVILKTWGYGREIARRELAVLCYNHTPTCFVSDNGQNAPSSAVITRTI